jgi:hypothetical protein
MTQRRIFLHIGTHKTATTTIQAGCCDNRAALLASGWLYPETGMYIFGQHNVAWEMCSGHEQPWNHVNHWVRFRPERGGMTELLAEINAFPAQNVILSSEDFDGLQTERIQQLGEHLKEFHVEVIVYLREQASFLQSAWAQFVKSGYVIEDFHTFIDRMLTSGDEVLRYFGAYDLFLAPWLEVFGVENVHPKPFSRDAFKGHIFHDFLRACEVPDVERFAIPSSQNISPGYKTLEMIRLMGLEIDSMEKRSLITRFIQRMGTEKQWDTGKLNLVDMKLHDRIQARFTKANQFLSEQFRDGQPFFAAAFTDQPLSTFDKGSMTGEEWEEIARAIATYFIRENLGFNDRRGNWKE